MNSTFENKSIRISSYRKTNAVCLFQGQMSVCV